LYALANEYGMRIMLVLNTTHMEQPDSNAPWLKAIIETVKGLPAFDLVVFGGDRHTIDAQPPYDGVPDSCGGESEAPLWLGPDSPQGRYVQWALAYGRSLGVPPQKLAAEAIVGDYRHEAQQPAGPDAQDRHLWRPLEVLRTIYQRVGFPADQRTYPLSFYAHRKCAYVESWLPCSDESQDAWVEETLTTSKARVESTARLTLIEFGASTGDYQRTVEQLGSVMLNLGIEGGTYWKWADETNDPKWTDPARSSRSADSRSRSILSSASSPTSMASTSPISRTARSRMDRPAGRSPVTRKLCRSKRTLRGGVTRSCD
jgi:hypothetical protein